MSKQAKRGVELAVDSIQQRLMTYACGLNYDDIPPEAIHAAKVRVIDTLGALIAGFFDEPCRIARNLAVQIPDPGGATVVGTRLKTTPDIAAYVNATTARCAELTDTYHQPGSSWGHPSDVLMPIFAVAEHAHANGREFLTGVVLGYEIYCRISDAFHNLGFDQTNFACLSSAVAGGKLLKLSPQQLLHCVAMSVVPNVILKQVRAGAYKTMFKAVASGQAGRAGVFAALLARAGMEGPHLPFEGVAGWCEHVARKRFSLGLMGGNDTPFKITETLIKSRPAAGGAISSILAAEKVAPVKNLKEVEKILVEVYGAAKADVGTGEQRWNPDSREAADHSIPYVVAATLLDGTVTLHSFNDAHLWNPELRTLMQKIEVVENDDFTGAFKRSPQEHRTRITVIVCGERLVGESGGDQDDLSAPVTDAEITKKFRSLTENVLRVNQIDAALDRIWHLNEMENVAGIPSALVLC